MDILENFLIKSDFDFVSMESDSINITLDNLDVTINQILTEVEVICEGKDTAFNRVWKKSDFISQEEIIADMIHFIKDCAKRVK